MNILLEFVSALLLFFKETNNKVCPQWGVGEGGGMEDGGVINCNGLWFENFFHLILYSLLHSKGSYWDKVRVRFE